MSTFVLAALAVGLAATPVLVGLRRRAPFVGLLVAAAGLALLPLSFVMLQRSLVLGIVVLSMSVAWFGWIAPLMHLMGVTCALSRHRWQATFMDVEHRSGAHDAANHFGRDTIVDTTEVVSAEEKVFVARFCHRCGEIDRRHA